jgi:hypothetical protein
VRISWLTVATKVDFSRDASWAWASAAATSASSRVRSLMSLKLYTRPTTSPATRWGFDVRSNTRPSTKRRTSWLSAEGWR